MRPLEHALAARGTLVLDGALATELERRGFDLNDPLWSARVLLDAPDAIRAVHRDYFEAGADIATSASYQATFQGFAARGLSRASAREMLLLSVRLACEARDEFCAKAPTRARPLVAASIGSYGAYLADGGEYLGDFALDENALVAFHRERVEVLAASAADVLAFETIPCLAEARALARLASEVAHKEAWLSFSCRDARTNSNGESIAACMAELDASAALTAVGVNCTAPHLIAELVREIASSTRKPIVVYPNSGERYDASTRCWSAGTERLDFAREARDWRSAGARIIGGCCRTTPDDVRALAQALA